MLLCGLLFLGTACSDKSVRMGEAQTLEYKRGLILENKNEISPVQAEKLLYFPGRTEGEIDEYFEELKVEFADTQAAERAQWDATSGKTSSGVGEGESTEGTGSPVEETGTGSAVPPMPSF